MITKMKKSEFIFFFCRCRNNVMPNLIDIELNSCSKYICHLSASDEKCSESGFLVLIKTSFPSRKFMVQSVLILVLRLIVTDTTTNELLSKCVQVCLHTKTNTSVMSLFINLASILLWKPSI